MQSTFRNVYRVSTKLLRRDQQTATNTLNAALRITAVEPDVQKRMVNVVWEDGFKGKFPFVWLLDCAPVLSEDSTCKETTAHNRMMTLNELNVNVKPEKLALHPNGEGLLVQWPPFHEVNYESEWLREHVCNNDNGHAAADRQAVTWGRADLQDHLPTIDAHDLRQNNILVTREKLLEFAKYGILIIKDGAANIKAIEALGYTANNLQKNMVKCYSHGVQGLHTGRPFMDNVPSLGLLVVRNNPTDTEATLQMVDGYRVAEQLQETHPAVFTFLSNTPIEYDVLDDEGRRWTQNRPVFTLSPTGVVQRIVFNNALRSSKIALPAETLEDFYKALKTFNSYCYQSRNLLNIHVNHGDIVLVANNRILHGNTAYTMGDESWVDEILLDDEPLKQIMKRLQGV